MKADFGGYASKNDLLCSDGRTIVAGAFKDQDNKRIPLVWQHKHDDIANVLGHVLIENRADGVYCHGYFNDTESGQNAKKLVKSKNVDALSIYANKLVHQGRNVVHGNLTEVSLVLHGANPGAFIDFVDLAHGEATPTEGVIYTPDEEVIEIEDLSDVVEHSQKEETTQETETSTEENQDESTVQHEDSTEGATVADAATAEKEETLEDVLDTLTDKQKEAMYMVVAEVEEKAKKAAETDDDDDDKDNTIQHNDQEGLVTRNTFEDQDETVLAHSRRRPTLTQSQLKEIISDGARLGSLKESFLAHAGEYGIDDIDLLFPDPKAVSNTPEFISRRTEWVNSVLTGVRKSPFSRIKHLGADLTEPEARAKGYVKGNLKKDEVIKLLKRVTTPKTIYKKQKLDRDDIIDITEIDVIVWLKAEMRLMLDEELARAILIGDGREPDDEDKIDEDHIRPIAYDAELYTHVVTLDGTPTPAEQEEAIIRARRYYKGTGVPTYYTTDANLTDLILQKDTLGRRLYPTENELAAALRVKEIVVVEVMEEASDIFGVIVNLADYTVGADKGGEVTMFDDFDLDYNQQKYLLETRVSGALTRYKSAIVIRKNPGTVIDTITPPTFVPATGIVTVPTQTGVVYKNKETGATLTSGAQSAIAAGSSIEVEAVPSSGYSFPHGTDADWTFTRPLS